MLHKQTVIFDLGGVLVREAEVNLHKAQSEKLQALLNGQLPRVRIFNRAFEFVALVGGSDYKVPWILGTVSGNEVVTVIKENIDKAEFDSFFNDPYERALIKHGIEFIVVPELLVELTDIMHEGLEFVKKCKAHGIEVVIISNWDPESFVLLKASIPDLFNLFDEKNIIIPQMAGVTKPAVQIYDYTIKNLGLDVSQCFFIDDSKANAEGARSCGITSVHHKNWHETERELVLCGLMVKNPN